MINKRKAEIESKIIAVLNCGRPVSTTELRRKIDCRESTLRTYLNQLVDEGKIIKSKNFKRDLRIQAYSLPEACHARTQ